MKTPICPTCGCSLVRLGISKDRAVVHRYDGEEYRFCCQGCLDVFVAHPEKYLLEIANLDVCPTCLAEKPLESTIRLEHDSLVLHFCRCPYCVEEFIANPDYFIKRLEGIG